VSLTIAKNNYGPTGNVYWFKRVPFDDVGLLELVTLTEPTATKATADLGIRIIEFVADHRGQLLEDQAEGHSVGQKTGPA
jgi:hypothetical protein